MDEWTYLGWSVAKPSALGPQLCRVLGGYELRLNVELQTRGWYGWTHKPPMGLTIMPTIAEVKVSAGSPSRFGSLGRFRSAPDYVKRIGPDADSIRVVYARRLSLAALNELEELRRRDVLGLEAQMFADGYIGGNYVGSEDPADYISEEGDRSRYVGGRFAGTSACTLRQKIDRDDWIQQLRNTGYSDNVLIEVPKESPNTKSTETTTRPAVQAPTREKVQDTKAQPLQLKPAEQHRPVVFIGHGHSSAWRDLKDHLQDLHNYQVQAYETGACTGRTIKEILEELMASSTFAILVHTGEDETADKRLRARQNVVHETGLFQGKLGFNRAIVLHERGVEELSNLAGVQYIGFDKDNIAATFGHVLATLKREFG